MYTTVTGIVTNGVIVPNTPLPEGAQVEIHVQPNRPKTQPVAAARFTPGELRLMPREERRVVLAVAAALAEEDYRNDKELTGFDAFSEEEVRSPYDAHEQALIFQEFLKQDEAS